MVNPNRFYVYAFLRRDRTPYYIGKGSGKRAWMRRHKGVKRPRENDRILLVWTGLSEEEAFAHEKRYIAAFGRKDLDTGILHNRTDGGEGTSGFYPSEEVKRKQSEVRLGTKWWRNPTTGEERCVKNCPGEGWEEGRSEGINYKISETLSGRNAGENNPNYGKTGENNSVYRTKWWHNPLTGKQQRSSECPGVGWVLGRIRTGKLAYKSPNCEKTWWVNAAGETLLQGRSPGEGWVPGRRWKPEFTDGTTTLS
jgi:hypothetical protein